jgi:hypothetical protein
MRALGGADLISHEGYLVMNASKAKSAGKQLGKIHKDILELLRSHPNGLTIYEIRKLLPSTIEVQQHLDKRVRELRGAYDVPYDSRRGVYTLLGERAQPVADDGAIPSKVRAEILHRAHGRCQMCGRTVAEDHVKLQLDHKVPRNWGGKTEADNLWALCQLCNGGKRDYFSSFDDEIMSKIMSRRSVYERIAETLLLNMGKPTPAWLLDFVANADDWQDDWQKRLRELRYPVIGMIIKASRRKNENGRWEAAYTLKTWVPLPPDHKTLIKNYEKENRKKRQASKARPA